MKGWFITGTDTGVGKTWFTAAWTRALRARGIPALGLKPILSGERTDAEILAAANEETLNLNQINPMTWKAPVAPYAASIIEDRPFDLTPVRETLDLLAEKHPGPFLIEAVGGWLVPLTREMAVRDWARELGLPVVVVCRASLGTLNHTCLTVESIRATGLPLAGLVVNHFGADANDLAVQTNPALLEDLTGLPVFKVYGGEDLGELPAWLAR